ncbi:MAG: BTAD domain-containing putative transcriptional regulator [Caldilineales bacterium]
MSSPPARLVVRLLGSFQLAYDGRPVPAFDRVRLQALLSYLLLNRGKPVSRQQLAFLFWPDSTEKQAFTNLRNLLHNLRQALPDSDSCLRLTRKTVQWLVDAPCSLDVARFENALSAAERAKLDGSLVQEGRALSQAVTVYGGPLLPDLYDDWVLEQRERLNSQSASAMLRLAGLLEQQRDYGAALETARRLLAHDPLREDAYRLLMRLYALNGDRAAALRAYHTCVTMLEAELGTGPGEQTQRAYQRLLHMSPEDIASKPEAALVGRAPLVDRQAEWQTLLAAWQRARRGRPGVVLIAGEAGIGKTRLAEELMERVRRQGITAASARAYEAEGDMAYAPLAELLRSPALQPWLSQLDPVWRREVARLVPEVLESQSRLDQPAPLTERWQLQRFFEALARAVLTGTEPVLLHLDDLQWCDSETLAWIAFLIRFRPTARLLVVGTVRSEEIGPHHPLRHWLTALRQTDALKEIELKPLDATATATLAHHIGGYTLDGAEAERFYADTEGNALFVVEMARARQEQDTLKSSAAFSLESMPSRMVAVLEARLAHLSISGRELAGVAAVIGREFAYPLLAAASGADENELLNGLEELWRRRIFRETGAEAYDFSHDKLREVAYRSLSSVRRRILHRRVAVALKEVNVDRLDELSGELGVHYERAGLHDEARAHLQRAGDYAAARYASNEALAYYTRALNLTHENDFSARFELHEKCAQAYAMQTDQNQRRAELALMAQAADGLADDRLRAIVALRTAQLEYELGQPARAAEYAQEAVSLAAHAGDPRTEAASLLEWSRAQIDVGTLDAAQEGYQRALTLARSASLPEIEARSLHGLSLVAVDRGDWDACRRFDEPALKIYRRLGDKQGEATVLRHMGVVDELDWYPLEGRQKQLRALELVREIGFVWLEPWVVSGLAWCSLMLGQREQALSENAEALHLAQTVEDRSVEAMLLNDRVDMLHQLDRFADGLETARQALDIAVTSGNRLREANSLADVGLMLGDLDRHDESADAYHRSLEVYSEQGNDVALLRTRAGIARAALATGDIDRAVGLVEQILPTIDDAGKVISISDGGAAIHLTCYRALQAANDGRAADVLAAGYAFVQDRANRISDPVLRLSFLQNLIEVNALVTEFERMWAAQTEHRPVEPHKGAAVTAFRIRRPEGPFTS